MVRVRLDRSHTGGYFLHFCLLIPNKFYFLFGARMTRPSELRQGHADEEFGPGGGWSRGKASDVSAWARLMRLAACGLDMPINGITSLCSCQTHAASRESVPRCFAQSRFAVPNRVSRRCDQTGPRSKCISELIDYLSRLTVVMRCRCPGPFASHMYISARRRNHVTFSGNDKEIDSIRRTCRAPFAAGPSNASSVLEGATRLDAARRPSTTSPLLRLLRSQSRRRLHSVFTSRSGCDRRAHRFGIFTGPLVGALTGGLF